MGKIKNKARKYGKICKFQKFQKRGDMGK
jgi:hypothetical protein